MGRKAARTGIAGYRLPALAGCLGFVPVLEFDQPTWTMS
jgi:hypothetical protein